MNSIYWQKLILRGFGPFEREVSVDFNPGLNLLISENESGKSSLVIGLAATLFGLDRPEHGLHTFKRHYNWNNPTLCEGELFFMAKKQHYHLQRLFVSDRVRLRRWQGSSWQILFDGTAASASAELHEYGAILYELLGIRTLATFMDTFCLRQLESGTPEFNGELQNIMSGGARYAQAQSFLHHAAERLTTNFGQNQKPGVNGEREALWQEHSELTKALQSARQQEQQYLALYTALKEAERQRQRDQRRAKRLEELKEPLREWQLRADQAQILLGKQAELDDLLEAANALDEELQLLDGTMRSFCQALGTSPEMMTRHLEALQNNYQQLQKAEESYQRTQAAVRRYGPLPLPAEQLLPLLTRRAELLRQQLNSPEKPQRYLTKPMSQTLATLLGICMTALLYSLWGQQHFVGLVLCILIGTATAMLAYRLLPQGPGLQRIAKDPISRELQQQAPSLGGIALMDAVALNDFLGHLAILNRSEEERPVPQALREAKEAVQQADQQTQEFRQMQQKHRELQQKFDSLLRQSETSSLQQLQQRQITASQEVSREFSNWRRLITRYPELPEVRGRDLSEALQQYKNLQAEYLALAEREQRADAEEQKLRRHLADLDDGRTLNIAAALDRLGIIEKRLTKIEYDLEIIYLAEAHLKEAAAAYSLSYRAEIEQRLSAYFEQISGPREQRVHIDDDFTLKLLHNGERIQFAQLSQGAQDQLRLSLRLALADHLSAERLLPMVFDDSFINCDAKRRRRLGEILFALSEQRQIWFLSHDENYASWGEKQLIHKIR